MDLKNVRQNKLNINNQTHEEADKKKINIFLYSIFLGP